MPLLCAGDDHGEDGVGVCCDAGARRCDMIGSLSLSCVKGMRKLEREKESQGIQASHTEFPTIQFKTKSSRIQNMLA